MQEIKCPKCGEVFAVDQTGYAQILNQVRDKEFERELGRREKSLAEKQQSDLELERIKQQKKDHELNEKSEKITELKNQLSTKEMELELNQKSLKEKYEDKLKQKDELIEYYKDFKARQSTKMVGESLEQHCLNQFNSLRMTAFQNAYFEKDNDARTGSKGDFIFRESSDGVEFISIMFDM